MYNFWHHLRHGNKWLTFAAAAVSALAILPRPAGAQLALVARADTLRIAGRVFAAESLYYYAVRLDPRNPMARLALGKYLAERGALKVGAVLMEEARYFGGDPAIVARALAPVYERLGAYGALASLPASPLPYGERLRVEWLRDNPPTIVGPDSGTAPYRVNDGQLLGRVMLHLGDDSVVATIDGRAHGLVLDTVWARHPGVKRFAARGTRDPRGAAGVVLAVQVGEFTLTNVSAQFAPQLSPASATIGLDFLGKLAPTFDPRIGRMLLRKTGRLTTSPTGAHIATLANNAGVFVVKTETVFPLGHPDIQRVLRHSKWTLDPRRGQVVVEEVAAETGAKH